MHLFLAEIDAPQIGPSELKIDNQSAISVTKHPEHMGKLKHSDKHFFWLREAIADNKVLPVYIQTVNMIADALTKVLPHNTMDKFCCMMGIVGEWSK